RGTSLLNQAVWRQDTHLRTELVPGGLLSASPRLHIDRVARGHCDHCHPGRHAPAHVVSREREIEADLLPEQSPPNGHFYLLIRGRLRRPASPAILRPGPISASGCALLQLSSFRLGRNSWQ